MFDVNDMLKKVGLFIVAVVVVAFLVGAFLF